MKTIISDVSNQEADVLLTGTLKGWRVQPTWTFVDCKLLEIFNCIRMTLHHLKHHLLDGGDDGQAHQDYKSWNWDAGEASCGEMTRSPASYCRSTCWIPPSPTTICQNTTFFFLEKIHPCANYYSFIFIHIKVILCGHFLLYKTSCIVVVCKLIKKKKDSWRMIVFTFTTSRKLSVFTLHGQKNRLHPFSNQEEAEPRDSEVKRTTDAAKMPPLRHEARGSSSLFNGLCASDTPPGLRPCEKGRRGWRSHPESDPTEAGKGQQPADITTKKKTRTHQMALPHLKRLERLHWPCRAWRPLWHRLKIPLQRERSGVEVRRRLLRCEKGVGAR